MMLHPASAAALPLAARNRLDSRALHIVLLLPLLALLNLVDLSCTLFAHHIGLLDEMNPFAESFLGQDLEPSLISYKLLMLLAGSTILFRARQSGWAIPACWLLITAYSALALTWYFWVRDITWTMEARLTWLQ
jgi:hypothetical protein